MKETEVQSAETEKEDPIGVLVEDEPVVEPERYLVTAASFFIKLFSSNTFVNTHYFI